MTVKFLLGNKSVNNCNITTCHYGTSVKCKQIINVLPCVVWSDTVAHGQLLVVSLSVAIISHNFNNLTLPQSVAVRCDQLW